MKILHSINFHRESEDRSTHLQRLLDNHVKLQQKWRNTLRETTDKFQEEITELRGENLRLIAENQKMNRELYKRNKNS